MDGGIRSYIQSSMINFHGCQGIFRPGKCYSQLGGPVKNWWILIRPIQPMESYEAIVDEKLSDWLASCLEHYVIKPLTPFLCYSSMLMGLTWFSGS